MNTIQPLQRIREYPWLVRGIIILHLGLGLSYASLWFTLAQQGLFWRADFTAFYTGWVIVRDGQGPRLYDLELQKREQADILKGQSFGDGLLPYDYPPHAAVPFVPLALLPRTTAFWVWSIGQVMLLVWLWRLLQHIAENWKPYERWLLLSAVIAFPPLLFTFQLGAFSLLTLICVLQAYIMLKRGREAQAGLWLVLGTLKPQAVVMPGLMLVAARRWRALGSGLIAGGVTVILTSLVLGWRIWLDFLEIIQHMATLFDVYGIVPTAMYNVKGTLALALGNQQGALINLISLMVLGGGVVGTLLLWRGPWRPDEPSFELRMGLTIILGMLCSPHLYPQDSLMLIAPAILFYIYLRRRGQPGGLYVTFVLSLPLLFLVSEFAVGTQLGVRPPVLAMSALALWMGKALGDASKLRWAALRSSD